MEQQLDNILDRIVDDVLKEFPEMSEFEASFEAIRLNLTVMAQLMARIGMSGEGLNNEALYNVCTGLVTTCQWMAAKSMASHTLRDIENQ